jgi:hypothetical protein
MYLYRQRANAESIEDVLNDDRFDIAKDGWFEEWKLVHDDLQVAYWRKANAIHAWFVHNFQDDVDECQYSKPISREALAGLVERCKRILAGDPANPFDNGAIDPKIAGELLPTQGGFFFGTYEYGEWYREGLRETIEQLEPVIAERNDDVFVYNSSW